jgi:hypothetical protein
MITESEVKQAEESVTDNNQLSVIVKESGLDQTKADYLLKRFTEYFQVASEWETRAKGINITDANCDTEQGKFDMQMARNGRLFLRDKRIAVEKARKELKEQSLREGRAIDGIANVLKALIVPIEDYLESQEKYVEIKFEREQEAKRAEIERRMEEERIAEEKKVEAARIAEEKRIRDENERLRIEAEKREKEIVEERRQAEAERKQIEDAAQKEREAAEKARKEAEQKALTEKRTIEERARKEREEADEKRKELESKLAAQTHLTTCPKCGHVFTPGE